MLNSFSLDLPCKPAIYACLLFISFNEWVSDLHSVVKTIGINICMKYKHPTEPYKCKYDFSLYYDYCIIENRLHACVLV